MIRSLIPAMLLAMETSNPPTDPIEKGNRTEENLQFLQILVDHYCYHDELFWGRTNFVFYIQAGALAGAFSQKLSTFISVCVVVVAILISFIWYHIFNRDQQVRDENKDLIKFIAKKVKTNMGHDQSFEIGGDPRPLVNPFNDKYSGIGRFFEIFDCKHFRHVPTRAVVLMRIAYFLILAVDALAIYYLVCTGSKHTGQ